LANNLNKRYTFHCSQVWRSVFRNKKV